MGMSPSETVMSSEGGVIKLQELRKWRRKPRELVKKKGSNLDDRKNGDLSESDGSISPLNTTMNVNGNFPVSNVLYDDSGLGGRPDFGNREDSDNSEDHSSRSSTAASAPRKKHEIISLSGSISVVSGNRQRNGVIATSKKARGFKMEMENSHSSIGSDSRSSNFVFVQGTSSIASKDKQGGRFTNDEHLSEDAGTAEFISYAEFGDVSQAEVAAENSVDLDDIVAKSLTGLNSVQEKLVREVQKLKEVGKDDSKISEPESTLASGEANTKLEDLLKKTIQAQVEYIVITTTNKRQLHEIKLNLRQKNIEASAKKQPLNSKLETKEDVKKLGNREVKPSFSLLIAWPVGLILKFGFAILEKYGFGWKLPPVALFCVCFLSFCWSGLFYWMKMTSTEKESYLESEGDDFTWLALTR